LVVKRRKWHAEEEEAAPAKKRKICSETPGVMFLAQKTLVTQVVNYN
jgi:hypothetical protein